MAIVNIYDAKTRLSSLVDLAAAGEDVVIGRNGKPVARITALAPPKRSIRFGVLKGRIKLADDFDAPLPVPAESAIGRR
ncbi:MAG: type II toxin-antitoxin system Phd/YefM family antitoxin [Proteobacteria bacterium]|nr:type II toxin-antitoxin system Phd/YefM family antitoxin [Pseudomonadota bacterium]